MNLFNRIFHKNWISCPRCLGKGHVDLQDIERLKMDIYWSPDKCAYCKGRGIVPPGRPQKVAPDLAYLSLDLPFLERYRLIRGNKEALERASAFKSDILEMAIAIEKFYFSEGRDPEDIAQQLFVQIGKTHYNTEEKLEMIRYIEKIIKIKRSA